MQKIDLSDGLDPLSDRRRFVAPNSNQNNTVKAQKEDESLNNKPVSEPEQKDEVKTITHNSRTRNLAPEERKSSFTLHHASSTSPISRPKKDLEGEGRKSPKAQSHYPSSQEKLFHNQQSKVPNDGLHLPGIDLLPGEVILNRYSAQIDLIQIKNAEPSDGTLFLTNYKFTFKSASDPSFSEVYELNSDYLQVPLGLFFKFEKKQDLKATNSSIVDIWIKDGRIFRFKFQMKDLDRLTHYFQVVALPERIDLFFAFDYNKSDSSLEQKYHGWKTYDIVREFKRQGMDAEPLKHMPLQSGTLERSYKFKYVDNRGGKYCPTYPIYFVIPSKIKEDIMKKCLQFRSRERLPVLTYYCSAQGSCLFRSAQSKPGIYSSRCIEDEIFLQYLGNPNLKDPSALLMTGGDINLLIIDARPYLSALANRANGKGFENTKDYKNCEIEFMQIENLHHVRESHRKLVNLCLNPELNTSNKWYSNLDSTEWFEMLSLILAAAVKTAQTLLKGKNVLVHCSDGWDRTAQICSLAQILLDPYFRTIEGFQVLIEKDWIAFGYQSQLRLGIAKNKDKEDQKAPILLQFLDCVQQLIHQFPFAFQFNIKFLQDISYYSHTCQFGTFLANNYQEIEEANLFENTVSLWSFMNSKSEEYFNVYYGCIDITNLPMLVPKTSLKFMRLWEEYYLYFSTLAQPPYKCEPDIKFFSDFATFTFSNQRKRIVELESKLRQMTARLEQVEKERTQLLLIQRDQEKAEEPNEQINHKTDEQKLFPDSDEEEPSIISSK